LPTSKGYKSIEFENRTIFLVYDPNKLYKEKRGTHRTSAIVYDKKSGKWELYPESYKRMYGKLYTDDFVVESLNTPVEKYMAEVKRGIGYVGDKLEKSLQKAKERMDSAYRDYLSAVKRGEGVAIEFAKKTYERAKEKYLKLKDGVGN